MPALAHLVSILETTKDGVLFGWSDLGSDSDRHHSLFPLLLLTTHANPTALYLFRRDVPVALWPTAFTLLEVSDRDLDVPNSDFGTPCGLLRAIAQLQRTALSFVRAAPHNKTSNVGCELRRLVAHSPSCARRSSARRGMRRTSPTASASRAPPLPRATYGPVSRVVPVSTARFSPSDRERVRAHRYFESPPRFQILHCLRNRVRGGTLPFAAASALHNTHPTDFACLVATPLSLQYINDARHLPYAHSTISLSRAIAFSAGELYITAVSYSTPFQAHLPRDTLPEFYDTPRK
ncbi:hypothetical protein EI94DRAFT_1806395 [Lactarius quietus]|nr:hypothetical protein EI94DRAFT_1806395 [Lactarius quietus]